MSSSTPSRAPAGVAEEGRSIRKRKAILEAATAAFLRNGYLGTTMDEIAARAAVSKQTVYKHFVDKERLFSEIVIGTVDVASEPVSNEVLDLEGSRDIETDLRRVARRQLAMVMSPRLLQLRRLVIGEAGRFPELGRTFYERGPKRTIAALATALQGLSDRGMLHVDDASLAAAHLNWLIMSIPLNQAMLCGDDEPATPAELDGYADAGVRAFLAAYGGRP
jgi:TetR/AcrR family transcriptional regulator, mexJK operon transcriptional repressor